MKKLIVPLDKERSYPIYIGQKVLANADYLLPHIHGKQVCIVTNDTVAPIYLEKVRSLLSDFQVDVVVLPDGESHKTLATVELIYNSLLDNRHNRTTTLIALGGGVVGDMTGYAAATYQRGVNFVQIPTTLLSQVDSSVGGKTGVNHPKGKNMIGAFYQPQCVLIDTDVLQTLPDRELSAGMAEVIKYGLLADADFYQWIERHLDKLMSLEYDIIVEAIERSCQIKSDVVAEDERESGIRATLNLGHTFGHAIEAAQGYGVWLHGEAVAAGMVVALELSALMGSISGNEVDRLRSILSQAGLPKVLPRDMTPDQFIELMGLDKKVIDGKLRLVLLESVGKAMVTDKAPLDKVVQAINTCF